MKRVQKRGSIFGLEPIKDLLNRLGNPQNRLKVIHVAGTNGKGSICTFLEALYRGEGKKVGRYVSPTLCEYLERFQIDGKYMPEAVFAELLSALAPVIGQMEAESREIPTAFELETVIAFLYFIKERTDIVILETGMGGRLDATNVVEKPLCTVFASIGMDHMQFLGETLEEIAGEKAGILKEGCPAVAYPNNQAVMHVLERECAIRHTGLIKVKAEDIQILSETLEESRFLYRGEEYRILMLGEYQIFNAVTAVETKLLLDGSLVKESLADACWEKRFELVSTTPMLILDGAHNVDGAKALKKSLQKHFTNAHFLFIIGVLRDKEYEKMAAELCPMADKVYVITPEVERGLPGTVLRESILPYCRETVVCESVDAALAQAAGDWSRYHRKKEQAVITAWGSLSYLGKISVQEKG
ncbi:MAG: bifunctional folylpolyglutamate synthase/dihydrofolate synthase [Bacteroidales bacterium]|nr:bifunctional folylpolyglutamate synthase/dihydrofolate synthase [Clostridium sp.]MCM1203184.1 bifunctional folylpolyglutamate synthase/dihydrofolate synthase [Bacteroidales bacterium]